MTCGTVACADGIYGDESSADRSVGVWSAAVRAVLTQAEEAGRRERRRVGRRRRPVVAAGHGLLLSWAQMV